MTETYTDIDVIIWIDTGFLYSLGDKIAHFDNNNWSGSKYPTQAVIRHCVIVWVFFSKHIISVDFIRERGMVVNRKKKKKNEETKIADYQDIEIPT